MTPTVMTSNFSTVVGEVGEVEEDGAVLADLDHGGLATPAVVLEAGHTHWDTGMHSEQVCMVVVVGSVSPGRLCTSANLIRTKENGSHENSQDDLLFRTND
uniref:AlNc14C82G5321 protein n=1 Tax=Albugo laibachii Nc14 TaxID=890382 RepID=F0WFD1_9STRA|nr:AlNc14C82G5321 [Albugo laibachii Nc14]|eukprot:CCA19913.1 AlNc14C82G5321 [Albugo laibachii Nc14]